MSLPARLVALLLSLGAHAGLVGALGGWLGAGPAALPPLSVDLSTLEAEPPPPPRAPSAPRREARARPSPAPAGGAAASPREEPLAPAPPKLPEPVAAPPAAPPPVAAAAPAPEAGPAVAPAASVATAPGGPHGAPAAETPAPPGRPGLSPAGPGGAGGLALAGSGAPGAPAGAEYGPYLSAFRKQVQSTLQYPMAARRRGLSGKVELDVSIDPAGKVTGVEVVRSSSHDALDGAAVAAVRAVPPLPFPPGLPPRALRVRLPLVFELQ